MNPRKYPQLCEYPQLWEFDTKHSRQWREMEVKGGPLSSPGLTKWYVEKYLGLNGEWKK